MTKAAESVQSDVMTSTESDNNNLYLHLFLPLQFNN